MAKKAVEPQDFELFELFERREDGRLYCTTCDFDTAQESNAKFHAEVVHKFALKPPQVVVKIRGAQQEEVAEIITVDEPAGAGTPEGV